jgi:hypothetical protein
VSIHRTRPRWRGPKCRHALRPCLIAAALLLTGLAAGCKREPVRMRNMTLDTSRPAETRPIPINPMNTNKFMPAEPNGPAAPPLK